MRILFVNDGILAYASKTREAVGGAERQQWYLAQALAQKGWQVVVGVRETLGRDERRTINGVEFAGIGDGPFLARWGRFLTNERPDWWYWRGATHAYGPMVAISRLAGVGNVFAVAFDSDVEPRRALSRRPAYWPLYTWGLSWTDRIVVQHGGQLAALPSRWAEKARLVPSMAGAPASVKAHRCRKNHVAWIGMLRQTKRPDLLVEVARRLPAIQFVVCGGATPHRSPVGYGDRVAEELRTLPNVTFLGQVDPDTALDVVADAALLLSTSDEEGFPNTFLEAWVRGTPVVSLSVDPGDVVRRLGLGSVSGGLDRLTVDIPALLASPDRRDEISARAREHVVRTHGQDAVVAAFESALEGVAA